MPGDGAWKDCHLRSLAMTSHTLKRKLALDDDEERATRLKLDANSSEKLEKVDGNFLSTLQGAVDLPGDLLKLVATYAPFEDRVLYSLARFRHEWKNMEPSAEELLEMKKHSEDKEFRIPSLEGNEAALKMQTELKLADPDIVIDWCPCWEGNAAVLFYRVLDMMPWSDDAKSQWSIGDVAIRALQHHFQPSTLNKNHGRPTFRLWIAPNPIEASTRIPDENAKKKMKRRQSNNAEVCERDEEKEYRIHSMLELCDAMCDVAEYDQEEILDLMFQPLQKKLSWVLRRRGEATYIAHKWGGRNFVVSSDGMYAARHNFNEYLSKQKAPFNANICLVAGICMRAHPYSKEGKWDPKDWELGTLRGAACRCSNFRDVLFSCGFTKAPFPQFYYTLPPDEE